MEHCQDPIESTEVNVRQVPYISSLVTLEVCSHAKHRFDGGNSWNKYPGCPQLKQRKTPYPQYKCFLDADLTVIDLFTFIFFRINER